jgi:Domain of unknown function (DU1801)
VRQTKKARERTTASRVSGAGNQRQLEARVRSFIAKFTPKNQSLIRAVRKALRKRFPTANELVWDNYNFFVIGYSATERPSDSVGAIAAGANGVGFGFYRGSTLPDPNGILLGGGVQNRFIRLPSAGVLERGEVKALLDAAGAQLKVPMRKSGKRRVIIRSVSAKQRPRK